ncbi:endonuclease III [Candidatus Gracilibacteria bacterium]|nr:endonuclease III [Candidatus Gracilibacteria bacterium]
MRLSAKKKEKIDKLADVTYQMYPDAKTELYYENIFQFIVAIAMSAQATDVGVNKANAEFFKVLKTPQDGLELGVDTIRDYIKSINFFNNKAKNIYKMCEILVADGRNISEYKTIPELTKLPGVGIKTAKVFLAVVYDQPFLAVDTHVHRVLNRVGIVKTKMPEETDKQAAKLITTQNLNKLHNTLILFGRYQCIARKPKCVDGGACGLKSHCDWYKKNGS